MKKYSINIKLLSFVLLSQFFFSQVGIGTVTPNNSATLDLSAENLPANNKKGFLLPRLSLQSNTDIATIINPSAGLTKICASS